MKKDSIRIRNGKGDWEGKKLTIGMDLGDRTSRYCVLGEGGEVLAGARGPEEIDKLLSAPFRAPHPASVHLDDLDAGPIRRTANIRRGGRLLR